MATDALLTDNDREEALSKAYVHAVAGYVGYTVSEEDFDRDGIDMRIHAGGQFSPSIALQLKATIRLGEVSEDGNYRYQVPIQNYERLIRPTQVPRYLVVLSLPSNEQDWLSVSADRLVMRECAYWVSLLGRPESDNRSGVTVRIPITNRFDPTSLQRLIRDARSADYDNAAN